MCTAARGLRGVDNEMGLCTISGVQLDKYLFNLMNDLSTVTIWAEAFKAHVRVYHVARMYECYVTQAQLLTRRH